MVLVRLLFSDEALRILQLDTCLVLSSLRSVIIAFGTEKGSSSTAVVTAASQTSSAPTTSSQTLISDVG